MVTVKKNNCPACGFILGFAPWEGTFPSDEICPCCGIQYGFDDMAGGDINRRLLIYREWKSNWIKEGMPWRSLGIKPPENWNPVKQQQNLIE